MRAHLLLSAGLLTLAGCGEASVSPVAPPQVPTAPAPASAEAAQAEDGPQFIPFDTPPRLTNSDHVRARIQDLYPPLLREAGVGGSANVWLFISETGTVDQAELNQTSGADELDAAAVELAKEMLFLPAAHEGKPVAVWVSIPITFRNSG